MAVAMMFVVYGCGYKDDVKARDRQETEYFLTTVDGKCWREMHVSDEPLKTGIFGRH
jgi:hypothetical protein